ncbi:hypothetical protein [Nodularia sphaerocarpa]|uniref:hypothetical protein n=1 Tax=Nodularia sphaerocarpa TaxID=137816 RepID=UPI00232ADCE8|nr:hypothetical protein [Nodularia sphaerocarpa]MDB9372340.1 hypothetical protein [Nodularia sphaerocarpa CS-585]MDB9377956.1 hypothetical protein [Nodularia sphaerocarpa CS-585A2]
MPKLPECDRCLLYAQNPYLICAVHPDGVDGDSCLDFREDPSAEPVELWEPEGARYIDNELVIDRTFYNGVEIIQPPPLTTEHQLELLENHPLFTGFCPQCGAEFDRDYVSRVHWDCNNCGWMDDTV